MDENRIISIIAKSIWRENKKYNIYPNMTKFEAKNFAKAILADLLIDPNIFIGISKNQDKGVVKEVTNGKE